MQILSSIGVLVLSYLVGAIPMGYISVKLSTGKDIRNIQSGRTGGTNAMRAAGLWVGIITSFADIAKGVAGVWMAQRLVPGNVWIEILAPVAAVIGHNYSIYSIRKDEDGHIQISGGAGGAPSVGGAIGLWYPIIFILVPVGVLILFGIGYASVATMSLPLIAALIFAYRTTMGIGSSSWYHVLYCIIVELLILWSLRPNIKRLINGTERLVGWRARRANDRNTPDQDSS
ncbi:MAG: glycerol-3-phosphate acyltransferase [Chloroflexota bacterium]|nr:glycerol-3-phosphate acyltransferase [Chloroflexota bacterium]